MTPINKDWCNVMIAKDQSEYLTLPAHVNKAEGIVTSCWKLSFKERFMALFSGEMYMEVLTFNKPLQPVKLWFERCLK